MKEILIFVVGAGAGSALTYFLVRDKVRTEEAKRAQVEIDKVVEQYEKATPKAEPIKEEVKVEKVEDTNDIFKSYVPNTSKFVAYTDLYRPKEVKHEEPVVEPEPTKGYVTYEIDEETLADKSYDFDTYHLYLFNDGVLGDVNHEPVAPESEGINPDILEKFIASNEDTLYLRNEVLGFDYVVCKVEEDFSE